MRKYYQATIRLFFGGNEEDDTSYDDTDHVCVFSCAGKRKDMVEAIKKVGERFHGGKWEPDTGTYRCVHCFYNEPEAVEISEADYLVLKKYVPYFEY